MFIIECSNPHFQLSRIMNVHGQHLHWRKQSHMILLIWWSSMIMHSSGQSPNTSSAKDNSLDAPGLSLKMGLCGNPPITSQWEEGKLKEDSTNERKEHKNGFTQLSEYDKWSKKILKNPWVFIWQGNLSFIKRSKVRNLLAMAVQQKLLNSKTR